MGSVAEVAVRCTYGQPGEHNAQKRSSKANPGCDGAPHLTIIKAK